MDIFVSMNYCYVKVLKKKNMTSFKIPAKSWNIFIIFIIFHHLFHNLFSSVFIASLLVHMLLDLRHGSEGLIFASPFSCA